MEEPEKTNLSWELLKELLREPGANRILLGMVIALLLALIIVIRFG